MFVKSAWLAINRVRKYKGLHSIGIADLLLCDGRTVDPWVLTTEPSDSSRVFSVEQPTRSDFATFRRAVQLLISPSLVLPTPLGQFVGQPHRKDAWFVDEDRESLFHATSESSYIQYTRQSNSRASRYGTCYTQPVAHAGQCPRHTRASVQAVDERNEAVRLHSVAAVHVPAPHRRSFLERIRALPNQSLWKHLVVDGDGSWIYEGLLANTLVCMSDGSYNPLLAEDVCACAAIIECQRTGKRASVTWSEKSDLFSADNYRAEILGGISLQLIIRAACDGKYVTPSARPQIGCDNKGVVHHGSHPWRPLMANQSQADALRYYRELVRTCPFKCKFYHVHGHLDRYLIYDEMTPLERLNCDCDELADSALQISVKTGEFISRVLPGEDIVVSIDGSKVTGPYERTITRHWGDSIGRLHYCAGEFPIIPPGISLMKCIGMELSVF
jgi:hypothetical protein